MPLTLWEYHESFWQNRRFVTWQLLRRNSQYRQEVKDLSKDSRVFLPKRSYPPSSSGEIFEHWNHGIELFTELVCQPGKVDEFKAQLAEMPKRLYSWPPQPDQLMFRNWLDGKELKRKIPYKDLFFGQLTKSGIPLPTKMMNALGFKLKVIPRAASSQSSLMVIRTKGNLIEVSMPFHNDGRKLVVIPLVDPGVDFPPPAFLPRFTRFPPSAKDKKAHGSYLYDQKFEPVSTGRGRPQKIKDALKVWDLSNNGMKDADIARHLLQLSYPWPDKSPALQRVHDLKRSAHQAIQDIYPPLTKKN